MKTSHILIIAGAIILLLMFGKNIPLLQQFLTGTAAPSVSHLPLDGTLDTPSATS